MEEIIEIQGKRYKRREFGNSKPKKTSKVLSTMAMMAMSNAFIYDAPMGTGNRSCQRDLPEEVSIVQEYKKILKKESSLSKWEREKVCRIFEFNYIEVE
jgi:hypothetical protein